MFQIRAGKKTVSSKLTCDRLSGLPDEIIYHILSFLPTKESGATCILSKRWKCLWAYVPTLDFDGEDNTTIHSAIMLHQAKSLDTFRIDGWEYSSADYYTWITTAVRRNVRKIDLIFNQFLILPQCLFTCKTLVDLRLVCGAIPKGGIVFLPLLKKLQLIRVRYEDDESLPRLLSGCPVLEELVLKLYGGLVTYCNISSPSIKRLTIRFRFKDSTPHDCRLLINTPKLGYLHISDRFSKYTSRISLVEADIYLHKDNKKQQYDFVYSRSVLKFVDWLGLLNIKRMRLYLSSHRTEIVDSEISARTLTFDTLTKLELTGDICFFSKFLESADNLESLTFSEISEREKLWGKPQRPPTCLLLHLRIIKLVNIVSQWNIFAIVMYLLKHGEVLERIEIACPKHFDSQEKIIMFKEISLYEKRASKKCELVFV